MQGLLNYIFYLSLLHNDVVKMRDAMSTNPKNAGIIL
jgi:hypothetical protein